MLFRSEPAWPADDPWFTRADWKEAEVLPPPKQWGGGLPEGQLPPETTGIDPATRAPVRWPLRYTICHWAALLTGIAPGKYDLRARAIDANGIAQPLPRPFAKSGGNAIETFPLTVE